MFGLRSMGHIACTWSSQAPLASISLWIPSTKSTFGTHPSSCFASLEVTNAEGGSATLDFSNSKLTSKRAAMSRARSTIVVFCSAMMLNTLLVLAVLLPAEDKTKDRELKIEGRGVWRASARPGPSRTRTWHRP